MNESIKYGNVCVNGRGSKYRDWAKERIDVVAQSMGMEGKLTRKQQRQLSSRLAKEWGDHCRQERQDILSRFRETWEGEALQGYGLMCGRGNEAGVKAAGQLRWYGGNQGGLGRGGADEIWDVMDEGGVDVVGIIDTRGWVHGDKGEVRGPQGLNRQSLEWKMRGWGVMIMAVTGTNVCRDEW